MKTKLALFAIIHLVSFGVPQQKMKLAEGNLKILKGQPSVNIEFSYDSMLVGENTPEKTYVQTKKEAWDLKESGKGEEWVKAWYDNRTNLYEGMFRYQFSKESGFAIGNTTNSQYTMIIKTTRTEPGWNVGIAAQVAFIEGYVLIVSTNDRNKTLAKITFHFDSKDPLGGDFEVGRRVQGAYLVAAKGLATFIKSKY
jgi:hypothetical protein